MVACIAVLQFFRPEEVDSGVPANDLAGVPEEVNAIISRSCFDCHSSQTRLSWYDQITPFNFIVASHIRKGKSVLNFSEWDSLTTPQQSAALYYALNKILVKEMPLPAYTLAHPSKKITEKEIKVLKEYVLTLSPRKPAVSKQINVTGEQDRKRMNGKMNLKNIKTIKPSPNGIAYISDYRSWRAISTTDRFDNGTMRIIFTNDVGIKAIKAHNTNPWPDGTVFAKAAWKQHTEKDGSISAGQFVQVEFMIKDSRKYSGSKGWGWARWKGYDLQPYGATVLFDRECISCHRPVEDNDYVFTRPLSLAGINNKTK